MSEAFGKQVPVCTVDAEGRCVSALLRKVVLRQLGVSGRRGGFYVARFPVSLFRRARKAMPAKTTKLKASIPYSCQ